MLTASATVLAGQNAFSQNRAAFSLRLTEKPACSCITAQCAFSASSGYANYGRTYDETRRALAPRPLRRSLYRGLSGAEQPRLRAVLHGTGHAVADTPPALHTSVRRIAAFGNELSAGTAGSGHASRGPTHSRAAPTAPRPTRASTVPRNTSIAAGQR